jgi:hypothetical protein
LLPPLGDMHLVACRGEPPGSVGAVCRSCLSFSLSPGCSPVRWPGSISYLPPRPREALDVSLHVPLPAPRHRPRLHRIQLQLALPCPALRPSPPGAPAATCPSLAQPSRRCGHHLLCSALLFVSSCDPCLPTGCWLAGWLQCWCGSARVQCNAAGAATGGGGGYRSVAYLLRAYVRMLCLRLHRRHLSYHVLSLPPWQLAGCC